MNADKFQRLMSLFTEAQDLPADARRSLLDRVAGEDREIHGELVALLGQPESPEALVTGAGLKHFADHTPVRPSIPTQPDPGPAPGLSGNYRLLRLVGEGGMGVVYEAEQAFPRRRVAIKALRPGLASRSLLRRFQNEAQILGRLQHPGIAQVYEAGTADVEHPDEAFLVMEFVEGKPIHHFATERQLDTRHRLELMVQVCEAVQHAHQRGVIHRDLKPANILVATTDAGFQPKVLDFGVARLEDDQHQFTTVQTGIGQVIGTLAYMSPEQIAGDNSDIDIRTDVYALGVVLYQLLTGKLPHDLSNRPLPEAARIVRDEPPTRLGTIDRTLRGDLEIIVAKAMEKDRDRRYQSATELKDDLRHFLAGEPISARRDSLAYMLNKRLARSRAILRLTAIFAGVVLVLGIYAWMLALRERQEREQKSQLAENNAKLALERDAQLTQARIDKARLMVQLEKYTQAEDALWAEWVRHPESRAAKWALWELYSRTPCVRSLPIVGVHAVGAMHSPKGDVIALTMRERGLIEIWTDDLSRRIAVQDIGELRVVTPVISPDGRRMITTDNTGECIVWSLPDLQRLKTVKFEGKWYYDVVYSPDGKLLALGGNDKDILLADPETLAITRRLVGHTANIDGVVFSPDSKTLYSGGGDETLRKWNVDTGELLDTADADRGGHKYKPMSLAISPDGGTLASGSLMRDIKLWDAKTLTCRATLSNLHSFPHSLIFSPDGESLYVGGDSVEVRSAATGELQRILAYFGSTNIELSVNPLTGRIVVGCSGGAVRLFDPGQNQARKVLGTTQGVAGDIVILPSREVVTPGLKGSLRVWSAALDGQYRDIAGHAKPIRAVTSTPDGSMVASCSTDGQIICWNPSTWEPIAKAINGAKGPAGLYISPDAKVMAVTRLDQQLEMRTLPNLDLVSTHTVSDLLGSTRVTYFDGVWSADSARFYTASNLRSIPIFESAQPKNVGWIAMPSHQLSITGIGNRYLAVGESDRIRLVDLTVGKPTMSLTGQTNMIQCLTAIGDDRIISGAKDRTIHMWDLPTSTSLLSLATGDRSPGMVAVSNDGRLLVVSLDDGQVIAWDLTFYDRHIAANMEYHLKRLEVENPESVAAALRKHLDLSGESAITQNRTNPPSGR